ncbi:Acyl-coenzyme A oxidase-like protein [Symbiodinium microadriaticum]|uniref:Acyl-coenzyme A oxidase-like protein n=1 Tax=Symbiodinium microadriaticum TaxID=2951 RepID=A0A1Q9E856_SYMMI|nr:Acyl-coenzyme A oxidase-like protein [Symbiodinium microadriaticum]
MEEATLSAVLAVLPPWATATLAFGTFVTAFAIVASTQALLTWDTIHWPWSRVLQRANGGLPSLKDPKTDAYSRLQSNDLRRRENCLLKKFQSLLDLDPSQVNENAPWTEHAELLRTLLPGGYLSLDSITTREGMLDFFASHRVMARQECLSCCLGIRMNVHYNLFCGTILALGSEEQKSWLKDAQSSGLLGCFMLTETGAGVLSGLVVETVATWVWHDNQGRGGFELHTPSRSAEKTWISQGLAADYGLVVAQLVIDQRSLGAHVFLVDMRSEGISRECMGEKTTFNALDNARVSFNHVQLPATALLSRLCHVQPHLSGNSWHAEYVFAGKRPPTFIQIAQRLLSGRMCISDSAITYLEGVLGVTKKYAEGRLVWVDKERKMPLADLPYMAKGLESVEVGLTVHKAFLLLVQSDFAQAIEANSELSRALVTQIAAAKVEAVDFAIKSLALLRRDVGSFGLMASSPFGSNSDILLCCRFAEGDSRVLQQMVTRDLVRAHSKLSAVLRLFYRVLKAWLSGALHGSAKLRYLRDQRLLQLLCVLGKQHWNIRRQGVSKAQAESDAWLQAGELVYDVAKTHAQQLIHSTVEERCGRSVETDRFMDMCISDCEARHVY